MLWLVLALMTAAAMFAVLWPLARSQRVDGNASDVVIYRDQLHEIERDRASGTIGTAEADAARVEVSRRLLAAADAQAPPAADPALITNVPQNLRSTRPCACGTVAGLQSRRSSSFHWARSAFIWCSVPPTCPDSRSPSASRRRPMPTPSRV